MGHSSLPYVFFLCENCHTAGTAKHESGNEDGVLCMGEAVPIDKFTFQDQPEMNEPWVACSHCDTW